MTDGITWQEFKEQVLNPKLELAEQWFGSFTELDGDQKYKMPSHEWMQYLVLYLKKILPV